MWKTCGARAKCVGIDVRSVAFLDGGNAVTYFERSAEQGDGKLARRRMSKIEAHERLIEQNNGRLTSRRMKPRSFPVRDTMHSLTGSW